MEAPRPAGQWAVGLVGGNWELGEIGRHLSGSIRISMKDDEWQLTADRLEEAGDAESVRIIAVEIVALINGLARVRLDGPDPISIGNVRRYGRGPDVRVFPRPVRLKLRTPTVMVDGVAVLPRPWEPDVELAVHDLKVQAVLAFLAMEPTWQSLDAALETVLADERTGAEKGVRQWASVPESTLDDFKTTANSFVAAGVHDRHDPEFDAPANPMTLREATALVAHVVGQWLGELRSAPFDAGE